jgi:hypothetical protein
VLQLFDASELELLISGMPEIDIDDWAANTVLQSGGFAADSPQVVRASRACMVAAIMRSQSSALAAECACTHHVCMHALGRLCRLDPAGLVLARGGGDDSRGALPAVAVLHGLQPGTARRLQSPARGARRRDALHHRPRGRQRGCVRACVRACSTWCGVCPRAGGMSLPPREVGRLTNVCLNDGDMIHSCACIGSPCLSQCVHGAPIGGAAARLPTAHTCFNQLVLPECALTPPPSPPRKFG